ncbi:MAG: dihydrodipicolinate synthase family protein [Fimbriimonadales bacterium]|nr:dihydrodipicolinate synthase family protein [Fimbriimonadales bacterium]
MVDPGVWPASVTALSASDRPDPLGQARLLAWFEASGCRGAVLAGTNGEGPSLSAPEKRDLLRDALPARGRLGLLLGVATCSLEEARWCCRQAASLGADGVLLMPPGYFREAPADAIADWLEAVVASSPADVVVYNFPQRVGQPIPPETLERLARLERFAGVKDSSGDPGNLRAYREAIGPGRAAFVGDETLLLEALRQGWSGAISGAANVLAPWLSQIVAEWAERRESAETKFELALPCIRELRSHPQPALSKALLHAMGVLPCPAVRLPLRPPDPEAVRRTARLLSERLGLRFPLLPDGP